MLQYKLTVARFLDDPQVQVYGYPMGNFRVLTAEVKQALEADAAQLRALYEAAARAKAQGDASLAAAQGNLQRERQKVQHLEEQVRRLDGELLQANQATSAQCNLAANTQNELNRERQKAQRLEAKVRHLEQALQEARHGEAKIAAALHADTDMARKYAEKPPTEFYDAVLTVARIEDVYRRQQGWKVRCQEGFDLSASRKGVRVIPLGHFNSGKTWLIDQLSKAELPKGVNVHTEGISIKQAQADGVGIILLDTVGSNSPMDALPNGIEVQMDGPQANSKRVESILQELRVQEDFFRQLCFEIGKVILLVVGQMSHKDQTDLVRLAKAIRKDKVRKDIVVVHNLREWNMEMLNKASSKDGLSYKERNMKLFGLSDKSVDVTIAGETKTVTVHEGLFSDEGSSEETAVKVFHYYLTNDRLECSINRFAIQDMRSIITKGTASAVSLAEELEKAAEKIQARFASFHGRDPPKIRFDAESASFRVEEAMDEGSVKMKPRDLGSYFTIGSDEPPHNITLVPCKLKTWAGRGASRRESVEDHMCYVLQIELPGLCPTSFETLKEQFKKKDETRAIKKEAIDGEGSQWTVHFHAKLLNMPSKYGEAVAKNTEDELHIVEESHHMSDGGTRSSFLKGERNVQVTLRTGIADWDTSQEPEVTYIDGVLGIALVRQGRA